MNLAFAQIHRAVTFDVLLLPGEDRDKAFKRLAKIVHPDKNGQSAQSLETFQKLTSLYDPPAVNPITIGKWTIAEPLCRGDIANLHHTADGDVFKIARSRTDNDLMDREQSALSLLWKQAMPGVDKYIPRLNGSVTASSRRANVLSFADGHQSLDDIAIEQRGTIPFIHIVWMVNRLTSCLGYVHRTGIVHGAIVPTHLMFNTEMHTLTLVDWCYSTKIGEVIPAKVAAYKLLYAPEVGAKKAAQCATDLYMMAMTFRLLADNVPEPFRPLFEWCLTEHPASRPLDAWRFQDLWKAAAQTVYGPPKFVTFPNPK